MGKCGVLTVWKCSFRSTDSAISKHKCKFFNSILSSTNVLCLICREFAKEELTRY